MPAREDVRLLMLLGFIVSLAEKPSTVDEFLETTHGMAIVSFFAMHTLRTYS